MKSLPHTNMLLVITSSTRLRERYGATDWVALRQRLPAVESALGVRAGGARLVMPDDELDMRAFGLRTMDVSHGVGVRAAVSVLARQVGAKAILFIGGDGVIPFYRLRNPVADRRVDPDPEILTDYPYTHNDKRAEDLPVDSEASGIPVGRWPDFDPPDLQGFVQLLDSLRNPKSRRSGIFAAVESSWQTSASRVLLGHSFTLRATPGWSTGSPDWEATKASLYYFNMHGFSDRPTWQGFDRRSKRWVDGVRPFEISSRQAAGSVVVAENCYGANIVGHSPPGSVALSFLLAGARAFVGATGLAFGSRFNDLSAALLTHSDLLVEDLVQRMFHGVAIGEALNGARSRFVRDSTSRHGLTTFARKTALQYVLYGCPTETL